MGKCRPGSEIEAGNSSIVVSHPSRKKRAMDGAPKEFMVRLDARKADPSLTTPKLNYAWGPVRSG